MFGCRQRHWAMHDDYDCYQTEFLLRRSTVVIGTFTRPYYVTSCKSTIICYYYYHRVSNYNNNNNNTHSHICCDFNWPIF